MSEWGFGKKLWPFGLRPRRRVILVVVPVSSRKTSRCGSSRMTGWRAEVYCSRACLTSGRSCSLARRVFFEAIADADEPPRKRGGIGLLAGGGGQFGRELRHGDVGLLGELLQEKSTMRSELGVAAYATGLGRETSPHTKSPGQVGMRIKHRQRALSRSPRPFQRSPRRPEGSRAGVTERSDLRRSP